MGKLKYGLKRKLQEKSNGKLGHVDIGYDHISDKLSIAVALRSDVQHEELVNRIYDCVESAILMVATDLGAEVDSCSCENKESTVSLSSKKIYDLDDLLAVLLSDKE